MGNSILKFCDLRYIHETRTAGRLGAAYVGYHLITPNDFARRDTLARCVFELKHRYPGTKSLMVTKERSAPVIAGLVEDIGFDGVQLHYPDSGAQVRYLRSRFGPGFVLAQVATSDEARWPSGGDLLILDRSYRGGSGQEHDPGVLNRALRRATDGRRILVAGGLDPSNIRRYLGLGAAGFDVQSGIKAEDRGGPDNADRLKMKALADALGLTGADCRTSRIGVSLGGSPVTENRINRLLAGCIDFIHLDVSDGFVLPATPRGWLDLVIAALAGSTGHIPIQVHVFASSVDSALRLELGLGGLVRHEVSFFRHLNRDNPACGDPLGDVLRRCVALDVRDVLAHAVPRSLFGGPEMVLCLPSTDDPERAAKTRQAVGLVRSMNPDARIILDRGVDWDIISSVKGFERIDFVGGAFLESSVGEKINRLTNYAQYPRC
jgi:phosphoribosylanthranilate isomerase